MACSEQSMTGLANLRHVKVKGNAAPTVLHTPESSKHLSVLGNATEFSQYRRPEGPLCWQGWAAEAAAAQELPKSCPPSLQKPALPLSPSFQRWIAATRTSTQEGLRSIFSLLCWVSLCEKNHIKKKNKIQTQKQKPPNPAKRSY